MVVCSVLRLTLLLCPAHVLTVVEHRRRLSPAGHNRRGQFADGRESGQQSVQRVTNTTLGGLLCILSFRLVQNTEYTSPAARPLACPVGASDLAALCRARRMAYLTPVASTTPGLSVARPVMGVTLITFCLTPS